MNHKQVKAMTNSYKELRQLCDFCKELHSEPDPREVLSQAYTESDFFVGNVRFISADVIDEVWTEGLIDLAKECYNLDDVPRFVVIDWEKTAQNLKEDGMAHHFNTWDGETMHEIRIDDELFYVFDNH